MQKYKELYDYCQTLTPKISRSLLVPKIKAICGVDSVRTIMVELDTAVIRGYFLSSKNTEHPFVKSWGANIVVLARGQNHCWERFVNTKELMHLFDEDGEPTDSADKFEQLLTEWEVPEENLSPQKRSENKAFWMALACLCPESHRLSFEVQREKGHIDNYGIALQLKIPEQYVPFLFVPYYRSIVDSLIAT